MIYNVCDITNPINTKPCIYQHFHDICLKEMHFSSPILHWILRFLFTISEVDFQVLVVRIPLSFGLHPQVFVYGGKIPFYYTILDSIPMKYPYIKPDSSTDYPQIIFQIAVF